MKKIRIFHLPVFIVALLCGILAVVLHIITPRPTLDYTLLPEYALALEYDQFICEDGSVWRMQRDSKNGEVHLLLVSEAEHRLFTDVKNNSNASELLPYEYAMAAETERLIFLRNDGSVWFAPNVVSSPEKVLVIPYYITPAPQLEVAYEEIQITQENNDSSEPALSFMNGYHRYYAYIKNSRYALTNFSAYLSVELKDGRYYLSQSADLVRTYVEPTLSYLYLPSSEKLHRASIIGNYTIEFCYADQIVATINRHAY